MVKGMRGLMSSFRGKKRQLDENLPIGEMHYAVIDTELTGLDEKRDSIVSIAAVRMVGGRIDLENVFYRLVNPKTELTAESVVIHGITPSEVVEKPGIEKALSEFAQFCGSDVIVGHCVSIDLSFINREMKRIRGSVLKNEALDTSSIYEWVRKRFPSRINLPHTFTDSGLYDIAKFFGIPVNGAHNAAMDAFITAQVFQRFIPMLVEGGVRSIGDLLSLGNPSKGGDRSGASREMYGL
jgi:DNA polymerase-3 subunit epsilon